MTSYVEVKSKTSIASLFLLSTPPCLLSHVVNPVLEHSTLLASPFPTAAGLGVKLVSAL